MCVLNKALKPVEFLFSENLLVAYCVVLHNRAAKVQTMFLCPLFKCLLS